jgi:glycosyltransferase involved in cell wall biosynthesis
MTKVSVNILTKNRAELLKKALASVGRQTFKDFEIVVVDDGSTDNIQQVLETFKHLNILTFKHGLSIGITLSRQEALEKSVGEYITILDDDDEWIDADKLKKQVEYLDVNPRAVLVGGGIRAELGIKNCELRMRPQSNGQIRCTMLLRNNFFTSTVMFRREAAIKAGGFINDGVDLAEDYDLWLRMGKLGKMYNFPEVFTAYAAPSYNKEKFKLFLQKQLALINRHKKDYPWYWLAKAILGLRLFLN